MEFVANGMVCSLGHDARTACAAARAGLSRPAELPFVVVGGNGAPELAVGHPMPPIGGSFEGDGRLVRLLEGALRDLQAQVPPSAWSDNQLGFYLSMPPGNRTRSGLDRIEDDEARKTYLEQLPEDPLPDDGTRCQTVVQLATQLAELEARITCLRGTFSGHTGVVEALALAQKDLSEGVVDLAIVGGVDSLVTPASLTWLHAIRRLKCDEHPVGLSPGEAAALVVLTTPTARSRLDLPSQGGLTGLRTAATPAPFFNRATPQGDGLVEVLRHLTPLASRGGADAWLLVDQNGEEYRANDWGHALVRVRDNQPAYENPVLWYPAISYGDTGSASGAVALSMALNAHERGYAPSPNALVLSSADGTERGGCVLSQPGG